MKAYEATLAVNGKWEATMTGSNYSSLVDKLLGLVQHEEMHEPFVEPKEIKIEVKEMCASNPIKKYSPMSMCRVHPKTNVCSQQNINKKIACNKK